VNIVLNWTEELKRLVPTSDAPASLVLTVALADTPEVAKDRAIRRRAEGDPK
jgi:hypothetical protein